jgi:hypothetical protein
VHVIGVNRLLPGTARPAHHAGAHKRATFGNPPGQRAVAGAFSLIDLFALIIGGVLYAAAMVMPVSGRCCDHAETIAKRIAAECDGRVRATFEFLLTSGASLHRSFQEIFEIVDVKVDMNRCPVSLISANVVSSPRRFAPGQFLDKSDLGFTAFENDVCRHRSSDLGKTQCVPIESQTFIELRNVN